MVSFLFSSNLGARPPPPPGFGFASEKFPGQTPGLLNIAAVNSKSNQQPNNKKAVNQRPPEDPSILWSKILSGRASVFLKNEFE